MTSRWRRRKSTPGILWAISLPVAGWCRGWKSASAARSSRADVPLAEMFGYSTTLRSMSQGRATYSMEFHHYAEAPRNVADENHRQPREKLSNVPGCDARRLTRLLWYQRPGPVRRSRHRAKRQARTGDAMPGGAAGLPPKVGHPTEFVAQVRR